MQIVINIDEETYNDIKKGKIYSSFRDVPLESVNAVANGTPLPKGHGRLIDANEIIGKIHGVRSITAVLDAPTIIEADTESEVGNEID